MKKSKLVIIFVVLIVVGIYGVYRYTYQPHETTASQEAAFTGMASDFISEVTGNPDKWQNMTIQIEGEIGQISDADFVMNGSIFCQPESVDLIQTLKDNTTVTIKGRFIGYDDLLEEIKMDKCIIIN